MKNKIAIGLLTAAVFVIFVGIVATNMASASSTYNLEFASHVQSGFPEQDVFIISNDAIQTQVYRIEANDSTDPDIASKMVFATTKATPHDPFKLGSTPLGPFSKGKSLGFILEQWLAATGSGTYTVDGDNAEMSLSFQNLVPNGTYTVWCSRLTFPPNFKVVNMPCGASDGSQNVLNVDDQGNTDFNLKLKSLPDSTNETTSLISLVYHSDNKTHGASPGDFGYNSHVQIFSLIPIPSSQPTSTETAVSTETVSETVIIPETVTPTETKEIPANSPTSTKTPKASGFEAIFAIASILAIVYISVYKKK